MLLRSVSFNQLNVPTCDFLEKDNVFTIYIKDLKLGKLGVNNKLVHYFIDKIDISTLITTLENNDIYCSINLQDFSISISQQNLFNMIRSRTLNDPNSHLINLMLDVIKNHHELYNFETENELKLKDSEPVAYRYKLTNKKEQGMPRGYA